MTYRRTIHLLIAFCPIVGLMFADVPARLAAPRAHGADAKAEECRELGSRRELFVDHYLIDKLNNARLVLHHPKDEGPVIKFNQPWEFPHAGCPTVN